ncbi:type II toxin-antitoxin system VapC family toxin [Spirulina sp. CCNP1310]|uniref:type II toxin-antitoxin system VapC family toxin n=1 Tax=Spirulina sp. CCNP1310 TaxID=3110249 RepID=UPI002B20C70B|nr:type II toxin-antitoxin system VapC family toxin [Spirulina sp. CCNP1310]MEA5420673.1 type II toxin-antitoxin system VapC family toxin [Spirulina sp. CCNP1310]
MSTILLDTHVFIWLVEDNLNLPNSVKERIVATDNIFVSIASFWEIGIKLQRQKVFLNCDFDQIEAIFLATDLQLLSISIEDTIQQSSLPFYLTGHRDPFDRMIISQAMNRSWPVVSKDQAFDAYPVERIWV